MPTLNHDLHGSAPDKCNIALLLIDWINDFEFVGGKELLTHALPLAPRVAALKKRAQQAEVPVIYVNDNFGRWKSDFTCVLNHCLNRQIAGHQVVQQLKPSPSDYFVLKPKHSGFYSTTLDILLNYLQVKTLVLTGIASNICVLFTANDAYMRDYKLFVPEDCVAAETPTENRHALQQMKRVLKADLTPSELLNWEQLKV